MGVWNSEKQALIKYNFSVDSVCNRISDDVTAALRTGGIQLAGKLTSFTAN